MIEQYLNRSMSFSEYVALIDRLLTEGKTTGPNQSDTMFNYGKLNRQRMLRLSKTIKIEPEISKQIGKFNVDIVWLVITEGWCGDAAQNIPVIEKLAAANHGIETRYILRDENSEFMDQFLTGGARSIPKLIAVDRRSNKILGTWGPRPRAAQEYFFEMRAACLEKPLINENLQRWYLADRGRSVQMELTGLLSEWSTPQVAKAA